MKNTAHINCTPHAETIYKKFEWSQQDELFGNAASKASYSS